ncbi:hypothetical protein QR98_0066140 [Sarcoptes scabiei]|uniref:Uncharacterized protein n=1 Tax=Sarcoptes scabiei TaxID=52283 RepID=A0A132ACC3_SARSC|nr:hypothetical protein QR98_0066140 [Sarcoptes scabiei]
MVGITEQVNFNIIIGRIASNILNHSFDFKEAYPFKHGLLDILIERVIDYTEGDRLRRLNDAFDKLNIQDRRPSEVYRLMQSKTANLEINQEVLVDRFLKNIFILFF